MTTTTPSNTHPCPTCRGIHTLIAQKHCPACGEPLLELPTETTQATDDEIETRLHPGPCPRCDEALEDGFCLQCGMLWELREPIHGKAWERGKHSDPSAETTNAADTKKATRELEYWRCEARNWRDVAEKLQQRVDAYTDGQ